MPHKAVGRDASPARIESASDALLGATFDDIADIDLADVPATKRKGKMGEILEKYYGVENNNDPGPDFSRAELELKCKPLKISYGDFFYPKEPLSVGMIKYDEVAETEYWRDIDKLERKFMNLLIVWFYERDDASPSEYPFVWWQTWTPSDELDDAIQQEYETIRQQVLDGQHLSQTAAGNDILQTCPKHNSDFENWEKGSYVEGDGHPHLDRPERRSWRIPCRFLVQMLAESAGLETTDYANTEYIEKEVLWQQAKERAEGTPSPASLHSATPQRKTEDFE